MYRDTKRQELIRELALGLQKARRALYGLTEEARDDIELLEIGKAREALEALDRFHDENGLPGLWEVLNRTMPAS